MAESLSKSMQWPCFAQSPGQGVSSEFCIREKR